MPSSPALSPQRRRHGRTTCNVTVQVHAPTEDVLLLTYAANLSPSGVYVRANRPLPVGTEVNLELMPSNYGGRIVLRGRVVRITGKNGKEPRGMGMTFRDPDAEATEDLVRLLARIGGRPLLTAADAEAYSTLDR